MTGAIGRLIADAVEGVIGRVTMLLNVEIVCVILKITKIKDATYLLARPAHSHRVERAGTLSYLKREG